MAVNFFFEKTSLFFFFFFQMMPIFINSMAPKKKNDSISKYVLNG